MAAQTNQDTYLLGRSQAEEQRLQRQARLHDPMTRRLFEAAGIGLGMKVLDLGSGAGDVAMLVAEMVGPTGSVVGVDMNPVILETARQRVRAAGHANVTFIAGNIEDIPLDDDFDAIVGRFILMYLRDPAAVLRQILPHLRSTGVAAFKEVDFTLDLVAYPPTPIVQQMARWFTQAFALAGVETAMGMKFHQVFLNAGFEAPQMQVDALTGGSPAFIEEITAYGADTIRSILPLLIKSGLATAEQVDIETLAERYRDEVLQQGAVIRNYLMIGAWAHKA